MRLAEGLTVEKHRKRDRKGGGRWSRETFGTGCFAPLTNFICVTSVIEISMVTIMQISVEGKPFFEVMGSATIAGTVIGH